MAPRSTPEKASGKRPVETPADSPAKRALSTVDRPEPPHSLKLGTMIEALDCQVLWYPARIVDQRKDTICVSFDGWADEWNEWLHKNSPRLRKHRGWGTPAMPDDWQIDSMIEALDMEGKWYKSRVLHVSESKVMVRYQGWGDKWNEWIEKDSMRLRKLCDGSSRVEGHRADTYDDVCAVCEDVGELLCCEGPCKRAFHRACVAPNNPPPSKAASDGLISSWLPPKGSDEALWHMEHDDGDEEDLDVQEMRSALHAFEADLYSEPETDGHSTAYAAGEDGLATPRRERQGSSGGDMAHTVVGSTATRGTSALDSAHASAAPKVKKSERARRKVSWVVKPTCPRHWCVVCKEAESQGYGEAMVTCVRCTTAVHKRCAAHHNHTLLSTRAMLCERCEHNTPKGLGAPDPVIELSAARKGMPLLLPPSDGLESGVSFAPFVSHKLGQKKVIEWGLPAPLEQALKERSILPVGDFAPKPYATLRRSVYKHEGPREKLLEDDVMVCFCSPMNGGCDERCQNRAMQHECDPATCPCGAMCSNRPFASLGATSRLPLQLFKTVAKGWGVKATRELDEGELVVEYVGEVIDVDTWEARKKALWRFDHMYFMAMSSHEIVDATNRGNIARFINHSCNPNLQVEKWYVNRVPRLGLWAKRPIAAGEELTYNYSVKWNGDPDSAQRCNCGSKWCTGYLGAPPKAAKSGAKSDTKAKAKAKAGGKTAPKGR